MLQRSVFCSLFIFVSTVSLVYSQPIAINEFMASNATSITDEDGDHEDWIELYNFGNETISLVGWSLSDDYGDPQKWMFPDISMEPGVYLLVWASGKDRKEEQLHTNFRISSQGEELILMNPQGNWVDEISPVHVPTDISYGRYPDGTGAFYYYTLPTPGNSNHAPGIEELLNPPVFSHPSGFYTDSFYLKVHHSDPLVTLRYTLDGSLPVANSAVFPDSMLIYNRKDEPDQISAIPTTPLTVPEWYRWFPPMDVVFKGTNIRVKAFKEGALNPFAVTHTFWVDQGIHQRYSLPVISISMDQQDLLGSSGIYTNFNATGLHWEREMHIAFFDQNGMQTFSSDAGVRVHGGNSRRYALKSFRVYFRNKYGLSSLDYPVFDEGDETGVHDRIILRNAGSDWAFTYFRDAFVQSLLHGFSEVETQAYQPAVVFLNSEYWGILNIRERYDNNYIENHYGYTEIDMLDNMGTVNYGSNSHYQNLINFLQNNSLNNQENYEHVKSQMDVDDFRDYHILQIFAMNTDQPGKNVRFWRPQTSDGKWRWMWWDMDDTFIFGPHNNYDRNGIVFCTGLNSINSASVNPATPPPSWAPNGPNQTFPLRALLGSPEFRASFINRFADLLNTAFMPHYLESVVDSFHNRVSPYLYEHYRRWHRPEPSVYEEHIGRLYGFSQHRRQVMYEHLLAFFELDGTYQITLNTQGDGYIRVNTLDLNNELPSASNPVYPWTGDYFAGIPIELEAKPAMGYTFSHWEGDIQSQQPIITLNPGNNISVTAHFVDDADSDELDVFTFWFFGDHILNDTPLEYLLPWFSLHEDSQMSFMSSLSGYPFYSGHQFWRKASMERRNQPTSVNYRTTAMNGQPYDAYKMRGIQIRQPFVFEHAENAIILDLPTTGFEDVIISFAVMDEGAAQNLLVDYSINSGSDYWITNGLENNSFDLSEDYKLVKLDFSQVPQSANNADFRLRIRFDGYDMQADDGNRVAFNNIAAEGNRIPETFVPIVSTEEPLRVFPNPTGSGKVFLSSRGDYLLFDLTGKLLLYTKNTDVLDVDHLASGIYVVKDHLGRTARLSIIR